LRRQLQVQLGSIGSSAACDSVSEKGAAAAPLLSVPAQHVRSLLHPYARRSHYTLVSDSVGVQADVAFGNGASDEAGDMCCSSGLAQFLRAADISAGSRVSVATCYDMQHLHISQLHASARPPPASTAALAANDAAASTGGLRLLSSDVRVVGRNVR
jgi:hypothetical protein